MSMPNFVTNGSPFAGASYNGKNPMMNMMMSNGCMPPCGSAVVQQMPGSSRMGIVHMNQQMPMTHLRPLTRFAYCKKLIAEFKFST